MGGPLEGIIILDLTQQLVGPGGTMLLGDMGATIIRVEPPPEPPIPGMPTNPDGTGRMRAAFNIGRSKKSVCIDLTKPESRDVVYEMAKRCDVVAQNYRPGVAEKLGMDREAFLRVNPDLIYSRVSAYGDHGPDRHRVGFDIIAQGGGGSMVVDRRDPSRPAPEMVPIADVTGFLLEALGIVVALLHKKMGGSAQAVGTSMLMGVVLQNILRLVAVERDDREWRHTAIDAAREIVRNGGSWGDVLDVTATNIGGQQVPTAGAAAMAGSVYYRTYRTSDGFVALGCLNARQQYKLNAALQLGDPRFEPGATMTTVTSPESMRRFEEMAPKAEAIFATKPTAEWIRFLDERDIACGPVLNVLELFESEHHLANKMVVEYDDPWSGPLRVLGFPIEFEKTPMRITCPAPITGQDTDEILRWAGFSDEAIGGLRERSVVH